MSAPSKNNCDQKNVISQIFQRPYIFVSILGADMAKGLFLYGLRVTEAATLIIAIVMVIPILYLLCLFLQPPKAVIDLGIWKNALPP